MVNTFPPDREKAMAAGRRERPGGVYLKHERQKGVIKQEACGDVDSEKIEVVPPDTAIVRSP